MPLGISDVRSGGSSKPSTTSRTMKPELARTAVARVGEPRLDGVDRARRARRHPPAVVAALGRVERGHERGVVERRQRGGRPGDLPVVGVDDVGPPRHEPRRQLHEVVVRRRHPRDEVVVGQPRQIGAGPQHPDPADHPVRRRSRVAQREQGDVVAGGGERLAQPVDVRGDPADRPGRELPGQHQDPHRPHANRWSRRACRSPPRGSAEAFVARRARHRLVRRVA